MLEFVMSSKSRKNSPNGNITTEMHQETGGEEGEEEEQDHRCGLGSRCSPNCSQKCHNVVCLLITLSISVLLQGAMATGFLSSSVTMLEKRFHLSSTQIGVIAAMFDIGCTLVLIPVTYLGGKGHKGSWIAAGTVIVGIGAVLFSLPQFVSDKYSYINDRDSLCERGTNDTDPCSTFDDSETGMLYVLLLGQLIAGAGSSPMYTIAIVYLDDNSSKGNSAVLTGIYYGNAVVGSAVGYLLSGIFLSIYGDFYRTEDVLLDPEDAQWYGAWWMGFVLTAVFLWIIALPLFSFANHLPGTERHRAERSKDAATSTLANTGVRDLCRLLCRLLRNPTYVLLVLADTVDIFMVMGLANFLPKYIEQVFHTTAGQSAIYTGLVVVPSGILGAVISGILIKKLKLSTVWIIRFCGVCFLLSLPFVAAFMITCEQPPLVGMDDLSGDSGLDSGLLSNITTCNQDCECWNKMYDPVCDPSGNFQFFSPCHAGCTLEQENADVEFSDCTCVANYGLNNTSVLPPGDCNEDCSELGLFLAILFMMALLTFLASTPNIQGVLRCVHPELRSLATGLGWVFSRALGTIPGPIIIGVIIDGACRVWTEDCGKGKNCLLYDNDQFSFSLMMLLAVARLVSVVLTFLASVFFKPGPWELEGLEDDIVEITEPEARMRSEHSSASGYDNPCAVVDDVVGGNNTSTKL